ncbi:MAG: YciI family protein [Pseudotabrizicola sp.]|uniref:YciI family protein n=1 Tax=Pseudotabrizicola sp. TaxID=2939647 RepID=UPI002724B496|nr:YciI family protein [Pseudotabrizicola sp.]MDO8882809.1 YciI family protein [Pseudotabrizicola sp.]MDP2080504.1 YciI family protein [Pseudotabrizicola sp.]MDZ7575229.1 YciI family protein [Pseudotabrizicola sp.]
MRAALICIDKPNHLQTRIDNRAAHLDHIQSSGIVEMAGPFLDAEGGMIGSLVILTVESMAQAQDWADADPYAKAGLFESVAIREWKKVVG